MITKFKSSIRNTSFKKHFKHLIINFLLFTPLITTAQNERNHPFELQASAGYSYLFSSLAEDLPFEQREHFDKLKSGYNLNIRVGYRVFKNFRAGITGNYFHTSNEEYLVLTSNEFPQLTLLDIDTVSGTISDDAILLYGAAYLSYIYRGFGLVSIEPGIGLGYIYLMDKNKISESTGFLTTEEELSGGSVIPKFDLAISYAITKNISAGIEASTMVGAVSKLKMSGTSYSFAKEDKKNISRLDVNLIMKVYF